VRSREKNIFYNILRNETSLTEVFCNLMQYKAFRDLFLSFVKEKSKNLSFENFNNIKYNDFETEKEFKFYEEESEEDKKIGRGDLILTIDGIEYIFELKIEITTRTTKNQPNGYLEYLKEQDKKNNIKNKKYKNRLFFILPKGYKHKDRLAQTEQSNILYWEDYLYELKKSGLNKLNMIINDFYSIVYEKWFYFSKLNFSNLELDYIYNMEKLQMNNSAIPTIMMKLLSIVDELEGTYNASKRDESLNSLEYVFWIKDSNSKRVFWFGLDYEIWEMYKNPFIIGFSDDEENIYCKKFKKYYSDRIVTLNQEDSDALFLPLDIDILKFEDTEAIKDAIDKVIKKIGMSLRA